MTRRLSQSLCAVVLVFTSFVLATEAISASVLFDQLNWIGTSSQTPDSAWGRATLDFTGISTQQYFNLNVNGNWVVRNMGVDSIQGAGLGQIVSTTFDLGVPNGTDVSNIGFAFSLNAAPMNSIPTGPLTSATVNNLNYRIGGIAGAAAQDADVDQPDREHVLAGPAQRAEYHTHTRTRCSSGGWGRCCCTARNSLDG